MDIISISCSNLWLGFRSCADEHGVCSAHLLPHAKAIAGSIQRIAHWQASSAVSAARQDPSVLQHRQQVSRAPACILFGHSLKHAPHPDYIADLFICSRRLPNMQCVGSCAIMARAPPMQHRSTLCVQDSADSPQILKTPCAWRVRARAQPRKHRLTSNSSTRATLQCDTGECERAQLCNLWHQGRVYGVAPHILSA